MRTPVKPTNCLLGQELRKADDETLANTRGAARLGLSFRFGRTGRTAATVSSGFLVMVLRGLGATGLGLELAPVKGLLGRMGENARAERRCPSVLPDRLVFATLLKLDCASLRRLGLGRGTGPAMRVFAACVAGAVTLRGSAGFCPRASLISPFRRLKMPITEFLRSVVCCAKAAGTSNIITRDKTMIAVRPGRGNAVFSFIPV